jgi:hypothetical protein
MTAADLRTAPILSAIVCKTNAELIERIAPLWLPPHLPVVDFTYGKGNFWTRYRPADLIGHDLYTGPCHDGVDFTDAAQLAAVHPERVAIGVLDAPYVSKGGDATSTIPSFNAAYGLHTFAKRTPDLVLARIVAGLIAMHPLLDRYRLERRITRKGAAPEYVPARGGWLLVKCMDYISGGSVVEAERLILNAAEEIGFERLDRFIHVSGPGPQPLVNLDGTPRRQVHSRSNYSTLLILGKV